MKKMTGAKKDTHLDMRDQELTIEVNLDSTHRIERTVTN
jgi:hypothetical protein